MSPIWHPGVSWHSVPRKNKYHHHSLGDILPSRLIIISFHGGLYAPPWFIIIIIIIPWGTPFPQGSSSYRHITSYRCGAETKSQKAQARYKYGPVFRISVVPRATGSSPNFRFHKTSQPTARPICACNLISDIAVFHLLPPYRLSEKGTHRAFHVYRRSYAYVYFLAEIERTRVGSLRDPYQHTHP